MLHILSIVLILLALAMIAWPIVVHQLAVQAAEEQRQHHNTLSLVLSQAEDHPVQTDADRPHPTPESTPDPGHPHPRKTP